MFDAEGLESFHIAGQMVSKIRKEVPSLVKPGITAIQICETIEKRIIALGGKPAFPVGVGVNEVAAHYTSPPGDKLTIPQGSLVKVDFGIHVNGYVTDTAVTVSLEPRYQPLIRAADEALNNAIHAFKPEVKLSEIGRIVQSTIAKYGFRPIRNLTGHNIERYSVHAGKSVPNVGDFNGSRILEGEVFAIEPFVTLPDAKGSVRDAPYAYIYRYIKTKGAPNETSKDMISEIRDRYATLPFAARWLQDKYSVDMILKTLRELIREKCVGSYRVLVEETGRPVAQSEHTVLVEKDGCSVLTNET